MSANDKHHENPPCEVALKCIPEARPNEILDLIICALEAYLKNQPTGYSRRRTLCESLLSMNKKSDFEEELKREIAKASKSKKPLQEFKKLGFAHQRSGKHIVLKWADQTIVLPCSPSDHRASKNWESEIKNKILVC